jgi:hypothetical protein
MNRKLHNRLGSALTGIPYSKLDKINRAIDHPDYYDMAFQNTLNNGDLENNSYDVFGITKRHKHRRFNHDPISGLHAAYRADPQNAFMGMVSHQAGDMIAKVLSDTLGADNAELAMTLLNATLPAKRRKKGYLNEYLELNNY